MISKVATITIGEGSRCSTQKEGKGIKIRVLPLVRGKTNKAYLNVHGHLFQKAINLIITGNAMHGG